MPWAVLYVPRSTRNFEFPFSAQIFRDAVAGVYQSERVDWAAPDAVAGMFHATRHYRVRVREMPEEKGPLHVRAYISV